MYLCAVVASKKPNWEKIIDNYRKHNNLAIETNHA